MNLSIHDWINKISGEYGGAIMFIQRLSWVPVNYPTLRGEVGESIWIKDLLGQTPDASHVLFGQFIELKSLKFFIKHLGVTSFDALIFERETGRLICQLSEFEAEIFLQKCVEKRGEIAFELQQFTAVDDGDALHWISREISASFDQRVVPKDYFLSEEGLRLAKPLKLLPIGDVIKFVSAESAKVEEAVKMCSSFFESHDTGWMNDMKVASSLSERMASDAKGSLILLDKSMILTGWLHRDTLSEAWKLYGEFR
jgi:hypothetical protein